LGVSVDQLEDWMRGAEDEHLEFKEAKNQYNTDKLIRYCSALANERGGNMVLGVTNKKPRHVVGTRAFAELNSVKAKLVDKLGLRIEATVLDHPDGRVLVFEVPSRPVGVPIACDGAYLMRAGEDLVAMTADRLKSIFDEAVPDYSAEICLKATLGDLDPEAIENLRTMWARKSGNDVLYNLNVEQLLTDAELLVDGGVSYAALALLGTHRALGKHLAQAEVIFEYRSSEASTPFQQRREFREGFFLFDEELWKVIDARNEVYQYEEGLFVGDIPTFDRRVVREALLNAVSHRDYRRGGSTFVRQFPGKLEVQSPGGFVPGITPENLLWKQAPRNRRIAEVFARCGLVERSGQGARLMFERSIREGKSRPDDHEVFLTLHGEVQDERSLQFFQKIGQEALAAFSTQDFLVVDLIHREQPVPLDLQDCLPRLLELGVMESQGRGKNKKYFLSRRFYSSLGQRGTYTRRRGLDKRTNKELLFMHIEDSEEEGARFEEFSQVLPSLSRGQIKRLMEELKRDGRIHVVGKTKGARWHPGPTPSKASAKHESVT
jgi:ATP-dependent DNA helicase RecG